MAECVDESAVEELRHLSSFLVREAGVAPVGRRVLDVYFLVGYIEVSADYHSFFLREGQQVCPEIVFPFHPVVQPGQSVLGIRGVYAD